MKQFLWLGLIAVGASVASADDTAEPHAAPAPPKFTCVLHSALQSAKDDGCSFSTARDGVVLRITNFSGIGTAQLTLTEGEAPQRLTVQFPRQQYMESFTIGDGKIDLNGYLGCNTAFDKQGQPLQNAKDAAYSLIIRPGKEKDLIEVEVTLPCSEPGTKAWRLSWINAFRR